MQFTSPLLQCRKKKSQKAEIKNVEQVLSTPSADHHRVSTIIHFET